MSKPLSDGPHPFWGRQYPQYTASYTNEALAKPLVSAKESHLPEPASGTIDKICKLGRSRTDTSVDHITLSMLTDLLDATKDPGRIQLMADPDLVSGCVSLMASVKPSTLQYEYGYVCLRILVIALNACIMKHAGCLHETIAHMSSAPATQRLSIFWTASSWLIYQKSQGSERILPITLFNEHMLDQLLQLLYRDEKLFLLVSKLTGSLGLSGLMLVLFTHLAATEKRYRSREDHFVEVIRPYIRIFWRYLIVTPDSEPEEVAMFDIHGRVAQYARLYDEKPVDVEDSINLVQALNERLGSSRPVSGILVAALLRFVAPLVVPGCESLIPTTVKLCIEILWNSMSDEVNAAYARHAVINLLLYLRDMLMALTPPKFTHQPWIWEVVDHIIRGDVLDLALRVFSTVSQFDPGDMKGTEGQLFSASIEVYIAVAELAPVPELGLRFFDAGCLGAWSKCYFYFRVSGTEPTYRETFGFTNSVNWACGEIIAGVMAVLIGPGWEEFVSQVVGSCDNPRCAMSCYAMLTCSECVDLVYCSTSCASIDWSYAWGGPHSSVCKQQARQDLKSRKHYHRIAKIPSGFKEGFPSATENLLSGRLIIHIRGKWSRPKPSTMQGVMVKGDYRNPVEFSSYKSSGL